MTIVEVSRFARNDNRWRITWRFLASLEMTLYIYKNVGLSNGGAIAQAVVSLLFSPSDHREESVLFDLIIRSLILLLVVCMVCYFVLFLFPLLFLSILGFSC